MHNQNSNSYIQAPQRVAYLRDRLFVPAQYVTQDMLTAYEHQQLIGEDPLTKEPIYQHYNFYSYLEYSQQGYYIFPRGDLAKIARVFQGFHITDQRLSVPMKNKLKIKFPEGKRFRKYQPAAVDALVSNDSGLLKAPPRSGKNLMMTAAICLLRQKTIVIAHQSDLLVQLEKTFRDFTNVNELATKDNPIIGFPDTLEDIDKLDVCFMTKQIFDRPSNKQLAQQVQNMFGAVFVDEAHFVPGPVYTQFINRFHAKIRHGVTATPARKDGLEFALFETMGPIIHQIHRTEVGYAPMEVTTFRTGFKPKYKSYVKALAQICESETRNNLILALMEKDVKAGHTIYAVTDRKEHTTYLVSRLKDMGISARAFNGNFTNKNSRESVLNDIRNGTSQVLVSMRSMATGIDIPNADVFYNLTPSSNAVADGENEGEGGYEQQCTRVLTPHVGKTLAYCRDFVDEAGMFWGMYNTRKKTYNKIEAKVTYIKDIEAFLNNQVKPTEGSWVDSTRDNTEIYNNGSNTGFGF